MNTHETSPLCGSNTDHLVKIMYYKDKYGYVKYILLSIYKFDPPIQTV